MLKTINEKVKKENHLNRHCDDEGLAAAILILKKIKY
jgi:hypothetical protein